MEKIALKWTIIEYFQSILYYRKPPYSTHILALSTPPSYTVYSWVWGKTVVNRNMSDIYHVHNLTTGCS
jgi:hypothetical protein